MNYLTLCLTLCVAAGPLNAMDQMNDHGKRGREGDVLDLSNKTRSIEKPSTLPILENSNVAAEKPQGNNKVAMRIRPEEEDENPAPAKKQELSSSDSAGNEIWSDEKFLGLIGASETEKASFQILSNYLNSHKIDTLFNLYKKNPKNASVIFFTACCLNNAIGCDDSPANKQEAVKWLRQAAEGGHLGAMNGLGFCLQNAKGCDDSPANKQEGFAWGFRYFMATKYQNPPLRWSVFDFKSIFDSFVKAPTLTAPTLTAPTFTRAPAFITAPTIITAPLLASNSVLEDDGFNGAGKALNLLGQLGKFSANIWNELNPDAKLPKQSILKLDGGKASKWNDWHTYYVQLEYSLSFISGNKLCFIPTSKDMLDAIKQKVGTLFPTAMVAYADYVEDLSQSFPIRFYNIKGQYYLTLGDKGVQECNKFLQLLHGLPDQTYSEETQQSICKMKQTIFELDLNLKMQEKKSPKVNLEYIGMQADYLQLTQETLEDLYPEVRALMDHDNVPTEYRFFEAADVIKDMVYNCIAESRPFKYKTAIKDADLGPFQNYARG